jgi:hypothetical protein
VETLLNMAYLYSAHVTASPLAPLIGFASTSSTLSKTVLFFAQEYYCNYCSVGHNSLKDLIQYWIIPNGYVIFLSIIAPQFTHSAAASGSSSPASS